MTPDWLGLLIAGCPAADFVAHRDSLLTDADLDRATVERDATAALHLRAVLDERRRRVAEVTALNETAAALTSVQDAQELLERIVQHTRRLLAVDLAYIGLLDDENFVFKVASGALTAKFLGLPIPRDVGLAGAVTSRAEPVWTANYSTDPGFVHAPEVDSVAASEEIRALLGVPLVLRGRVLGALFACTRAERRFESHEVALMVALAAHATIALDNAATLAEQREVTRRLADANATLAERTRQLEQAMRWDRALTEAVLSGDDVDAFVARVGVLSGCGAEFWPADRGEKSGDPLVSALAQAVDQAGPDEVVRAEYGPDHAVGCAVRSGTSLLGVLLARGEPGQLAEAGLLLERAAPAVAMSVVARRSASEADRHVRDALLVDLLTRTPDRGPAETGDCRRAGIDPTTPCMVVVVSPGAGVRPIQLARLLSLPVDHRFVEHAGLAVFVLPGISAETVLEAWPNGSAATAGVAGPAAGPEQLAGCFREASQALDVLLALQRHGEVTTAARLGIYRVLLSHAGRTEIDALVRAELGSLQAEEARRGTPLLETLDVYLRNGRRHAAAAKDLDIHVNTLYQRLEVIDGVLGPRWRDPERALHLQLALRLSDAAARLLGAH